GRKPRARRDADPAAPSAPQADDAQAGLHLAWHPPADDTPLSPLHARRVAGGLQDGPADDLNDWRITL
ncbi:MAG: hypothetical protein ACK4PH_28140, partial [Aquincola tertiaricarbonis]